MATGLRGSLSLISGRGSRETLLAFAGQQTPETATEKSGERAASGMIGSVRLERGFSLSMLESTVHYATTVVTTGTAASFAPLGRYGAVPGKGARPDQCANRNGCRRGGWLLGG